MCFVVLDLSHGTKPPVSLSLPSCHAVWFIWLDTGELTGPAAGVLASFCFLSLVSSILPAFLQ